MKTLIIAINSKYIHSSLAPWYLKTACGENCGAVEVLEFSINDEINKILGAIFKQKPDVAAFSCYIWNIEYVLKLSEALKAVLPDCKLVLGGPEVSYQPVKMMETYPWINYILAGEGEESFPALVEMLKVLKEGSRTYLNLNTIINKNTNTNTNTKININTNDKDLNKEETFNQFLLDDNLYKLLSNISGITYRQNNEIKTDNKFNLIANLDSIPSPYTAEMLERASGKLVYFEASRGCPFSCSYCISSTFQGVRYFSFERVKEDLDKLINFGVKKIKFVDRTFNSNKARAKEIVKYILENHGESTFHFEVAGDLFDDELIELLASAPKGLIQLEIGVQSFNDKTLTTVNRKTDLVKLQKNVRELLGFANMHIHLDLIAGLPFEDFESFKESFNKVIALKPHQLQLGFLKLLKGSDIEKNAQSFGYKHRSFPPYEVLENNFMSYDEMLLLKDVEELVERYYNSGRFTKTLEIIMKHLSEDTAFDFFFKFANWSRKSGYLDRSISHRECFVIIYKFLSDNSEMFSNKIVNGLFRELLVFDFLSSDSSGKLPQSLEVLISNDEFKQFNDVCFTLLANSDFVQKFLPMHVGIPSKQIYKRVKFYRFSKSFMNLLVEDFTEANWGEEVNGLIIFDYSLKNPVTERFSFHVIVN